MSLSSSEDLQDSVSGMEVMDLVFSLKLSRLSECNAKYSGLCGGWYECVANSVGLTSLVQFVNKK